MPCIDSMHHFLRHTIKLWLQVTLAVTMSKHATPHGMQTFAQCLGCLDSEYTDPSNKAYILCW